MYLKDIHAKMKSDFRELLKVSKFSQLAAKFSDENLHVLLTTFVKFLPISPKKLPKSIFEFSSPIFHLQTLIQFW
jgi:hypothetical protein